MGRCRASRQAGKCEGMHSKQVGRQAGRGVQAVREATMQSGRQGMLACLVPGVLGSGHFQTCTFAIGSIIVMFDTFGVKVGCGKSFGIGVFEECACHTDSHQRSMDGQMTSETHCVALAKHHAEFLPCLLTCYGPEEEYEVWLLRDLTAALPPPASVKQGPPWLQKCFGKPALVTPIGEPRFSMLLAGSKKCEFRQNKAYWRQRLLKFPILRSIRFRDEYSAAF